MTLALETMHRNRNIMIHILMSFTASVKPCPKVCASLLTQSSSPISSSNRQIASWRSSSVSQGVVRGKLGSTMAAMIARKLEWSELENSGNGGRAYTVMTPSMMNSHRLSYSQLRSLCSAVSDIPGGYSPRPSQSVQNSGSDQPRKCSRNQTPRVKHRGSETKLFTSIPSG